MAKFILLLVFVCFQFSNQEKLVEADNELVNLDATTKGYEPLGGTAKKLYNKDDKADGEWTEEDEKWLQGILEFLGESDEDYDSDSDDDSEEFDKIMEELDKYFGDSDESDSSEEWPNDDDWNLEFSRYPDYLDKEGHVVTGDLDVYYTWLYQTLLNNANNKKKQPFKRFSSV